MTKNVSQITQVNVGKKGVLLVFTPTSPMNEHQIKNATDCLTRQALQMAIDMRIPVYPIVAQGGSIEVIPCSNKDLDERLRKVEEWIDAEDTRALEASEY